jgi:hypothetical protein
MEVPNISMLLNIQSGIKLSNHHVVPIFLEGDDISQVFGSASSHTIIKNRIMLVFLITLINPLGDGYWLALWKNHTLIEVLLKPSVEPVVISIPREKPLILLPHLPRCLSLPFVAHFLPPSWILGNSQRKSSHVHIGLRQELI